jgi:hypothetical protein
MVIGDWGLVIRDRVEDPKSPNRLISVSTRLEIGNSGPNPQSPIPNHPNCKCQTTSSLYCTPRPGERQGKFGRGSSHAIIDGWTRRRLFRSFPRWP